MLYAFAVSGREAEIVRLACTGEEAAGRMNGRLLELRKDKARQFVKQLWDHAAAQKYEHGSAEYNLIVRLTERAAKVLGPALLEKPVVSDEIPIVNGPEMVHNEPTEDGAEPL
jgi:hypothetical protein